MIKGQEVDMIGSRHAEMQKRIEKLIADHRHEMENAELNFLEEMWDKLKTYGQSTFMTVPQMNKVTRMEADLARAKFNRY